jgi:inorganic pyrophosphatase
MRIDAIPVGHDAPREVNVIIEIPKDGEPIKYEMDKASGALVVDRFLSTPDALPVQLRVRPAHRLRTTVTPAT